MTPEKEIHMSEDDIAAVRAVFEHYDVASQDYDPLDALASLLASLRTQLADAQRERDDAREDGRRWQESLGRCTRQLQEERERAGEWKMQAMSLLDASSRAQEALRAIDADDEGREYVSGGRDQHQDLAAHALTPNPPAGRTPMGREMKITLIQRLILRLPPKWVRPFSDDWFHRCHLARLQRRDPIDPNGPFYTYEEWCELNGREVPADHPLRGMGGENTDG